MRLSATPRRSRREARRCGTARSCRAGRRRAGGACAPCRRTYRTGKRGKRDATASSREKSSPLKTSPSGPRPSDNTGAVSSHAAAAGARIVSSCEAAVAAAKLRRSVSGDAHTIQDSLHDRQRAPVHRRRPPPHRQARQGGGGRPPTSISSSRATSPRRSSATIASRSRQADASTRACGTRPDRYGRPMSSAR